MEYKNLGQYLKRKRIEAGLSQTQLAKSMGYPCGQYTSNWERGVCAPPTDGMETVIKMLKLDRKKILDAMVKDFEESVRQKLFKKKAKAS